MRVLFLPSWYPNIKSQFDGNFIQNHAQAISNAGEADVIVLFVTSLQHISKNETHQLKVNNHLTEIRVYYPYHKWLWVRAWREFSAYRSAISDLRDIHLLHSHVFFSLGVFAVIVSFIRQIPVLHTEHSSAFHELSFWQKCVFSILGKRIAMHCPVSQDLGRSTAASGVSADRIHVIPNTLDIHRFQIHPQPPLAPFRFLHVSAYHDPRKQIEYLLRSFEQLIGLGHDAHLEIGGDGDHEWLLALIDTTFLHIKDNITCSEKWSDTELVYAYTRSHAHVLSSRFENFGMVLAESILCGRPVIAPSVGGVVDFVTADNGILYQPTNHDSLLKAMQQMIDHYAKFDPAVVRRTISSSHSYEQIGYEYVKMYKSMLD